MKIKKIIAASMPEAMKKVKDVLGADAVILNSKEVHRGGFFGLFTKKNVEVIAAVDPTPPRLERPTKGNEGAHQEPKHIQTIEQREHLTSHSVLFPAPEEMLGKQSSIFKPFIDRLEQQEITQPVKDQLLNSLMRGWFKQDESLRVEELTDILFEKIHTLGKDLPFGGTQNHKIINLVGPTGVGKTTTIAKLASKAVLEDHLKVAMITTDTYRIAAIDQLKTYAELLNVPVKVAYTLEDYQEAIAQFQDYDLILIDSAGRNYQDKAYVEELKKIMTFDDSLITYLVLSATSKYQDMEEITKQFLDLPIRQLIITKTDETKSYGPIFCLMTKYSLGGAYMTNGQSVPDDIYEASLNDIAKKIVGDEGQ